MANSMDNITIGILGPRPFLVGGHDRDNTTRAQIYKSIYNRLAEFKKVANVVGVTGLSPGVETDFVHACIALEIPYIVYLAFSDQESQWVNIHCLETYRQLLARAESTIALDDGGFSPKKILKRDTRILETCDYTMVVDNPLRSYVETASRQEIKNKIIRIRWTPSDD